METISFNSTKGGTGKTTLSVITINALTQAGYKCLAIDTDIINHSLSFYYNANIDIKTISQKNIFNVFTGEPLEKNLITINKNLDFLHADVRLTDYRSMNSLNRLKKILRPLTKYDYVIIDTSPTYDNITANVFNASNYLFIPLIPDIFNYQSVKYLFSKIEDLDLFDLDVNIIFNQYDKPRTENKKTFSNQVIDLFLKDPILKNHITHAYISKSSNIKKYINDIFFNITNNKKTKKQHHEILTLLKSMLNLNLDIKEI